MLVVWLWLGAATSLADDKSKEWPAIPPEDLALKDNPAEPGSSAMILLKEDSRDDEKGTRVLFYRIKIFKESGREHGNVEVYYAKGILEVEDLEARVVQPDGRIVEFHGPFYDKVASQTRKRRVMAKTLALPGVRPGSIIEYRYRLKWKGNRWFGNTWVVQEPLFVREARLTYRPALRWTSNFRNLIPRRLPQQQEWGTEQERAFRVVLHDIPALIEEPLMPPDGSMQGRFVVLYSDLGNSGWNQRSKEVNDFLGKPKKLEREARQIIGGETDPVKKLRRLYAVVQEQVRNLSYEETYTKKERKREGLKERKSAEDVWKYRYGLDFEINRLFAALCRAAGFEADVAFVAPRDDSLLDPEIPLQEQATNEIVVVNVPGKTLSFDPGTRFMPFGQLSWENRSVKAVRLGEKVWTEIKTHPTLPEESVTETAVELRLRPDGSGTMTVTNRFTGQAAVALRNDMFDLTDEQRERKFRERLEDRLSTADIQEVRWSGLDSADDAAEVVYVMELPDGAYRQGRRLFVRKRMLHYRSPLLSWKRVHPVYLRYSSTVARELRIIPPEGFVLEKPPEPIHVQGIKGTYEATTQVEDGNTVVYRDKSILHEGLLRKDEEYLVLKRYFDFVAAQHDSHLVLRRQEAKEE